MTKQGPAPVADLDWDGERARALGAAAIDLWGELLDRLRTLPIGLRTSAEEVRALVTRDIPDEPTDIDELVDHLRTLIFDATTRTGHPAFVAYISGSGTIPGAAADLIAAAINQNVGGARLSPGATEIEQHLMKWFAGRLGLPPTAGGLLTSGGAMANFIGLKAARDARCGFDIRAQGVRPGPPLAIYVSDEVHVVNDRAADMLGLGRDAVRRIPTDDARRMRTDALDAAIRKDRDAGIRPIAVVATAGTVGTGAIDPLDTIADIAEQHGLWLHVDGAYGGIAAMVDALKPAFRGIERADSIAFDPHKWLYTPHSGGGVVVRDMRHLADSFSVNPSYIYDDPEITRRGPDFLNFGPQFSRGFQALKVWISLLAHGWAAYSRRIAHDVELARWLYERAAERPEFEPIGPPPELSIACFRYVPPDARDDEEYLNKLNEQLMLELQLDGRVYPSNAVVGGRFAIRACIVNFRTEAEDLERLLDVAAEIGARLHANGPRRP